MTETGIVYLLHFARPLGGRASHYLGLSTLDGLVERIAAHRHGRGAKITAAANREGIEYELVRTWPGGRALERRLKAAANAARWCPICRPGFLRRDAARVAGYTARRRAPAEYPPLSSPLEVA